MVSHLNMVSVAKSVIEYLGNRPDDVILTTLPLSFGYGLYQVLMAFMFGGTVILEKSFAYPATILARMQQERATGFPLVPMIAAVLVKMTNLNTYGLDSLRYLTNAAAALPVQHIRKLRSLLPHVTLFSMYGLTECKRVSYLPPEELDRRPDSVGVAIPNTEVFILNEAGNEVPPGEVGELVVRGSHVTCGYWNAPELTAQTFRPGRFPGDRLLYSGDLFKKDEAGFLYFVARKNDLIKTRGERVSPREIENVLHEMDGILDAAVFGVPDEIIGQAITACIVMADNRPAPAVRDVLKFCSDRLESFMMPKQVVFVNELPKTPNGKIDKDALKRDYAKQANGLSPRHTQNPLVPGCPLPVRYT
jgi:acyl-CoA synthetase (AMP-forming)/AMP-acid ligase II